MTGEVTAPGESAGLPAGLGVALQIGGAILSGIFNRKARKKLKRARRLQRLNTQLANAQSRRQFVAGAALARANVIASGTVNEGSLDSSRTQGQLASIDTQTQLALNEQKIVASRNRQISRLVDSAGGSARRGQTVSTIASTGADVLGELKG